MAMAFVTAAMDRDYPDMRGGIVTLPDLVADIKLTAGELRALATKT